MNYTEFFTVLFPKYNQDKKIGSAGSQHFEGKKKKTCQFQQAHL